MRVLIQQVERARVSVANRTVGSIKRGLLVFLGVHKEDQQADSQWLADKTVGLRVFKDEQEKMNLSLMDVGREVLIVSQFTLYADCMKGKRPSFINSARPGHAKELYEDFIARVREKVSVVQTGEFGAHMKVELVNDGPLTFWIDSRDRP